MLVAPNILFWAIIIGLISAFFARFQTQKNYTFLITFLVTIATVVAWNWMIKFTKATIYLNVDHPVLRISWADFLDGVSVFAMISFILGIFTLKQEKAAIVTKIALFASLVTIFTDIFFF